LGTDTNRRTGPEGSAPRPPEGDANSLDPQQLQTLDEGQILSNIYEGLVRTTRRPCNLWQPSRKKYEVSSDRLKIHLHIRKASKFHNGRELTADDVKYTFNRMGDAKWATTYAPLDHPGQHCRVADVDSGKTKELTGR